VPKIRVVQNNFTAGEISPYLHGRPDFPAYPNGVEVLDNFIALPHGGAIRRSGFRYVDFAKRDAEPLYRQWRLIPFVYSEEQSYVLEFGHQYIRFYKNDKTRIDYELASPYTYEDLQLISYAQSANVLYLFHENYQTRRLIRLADDNWVLNTVEFYDGPYHGLSIYDGSGGVQDWTMTPSAVSPINAAITINIKDSDGNPITPLNSYDVGRYIRIEQVVFDSQNVPSMNWGVAKITSLNQTAPQVNATIVSTFGNLNPSDRWKMSIFQGPDRWPKFGTIHEGRLVVAGTKDYPNSVFGSVIDDLTNFNPSDRDGQVNDDHSYNYTLGSNTIDQITWLSSGKALMVGTLGGPYSLSGGDIRIAVGPLAIKATKENSNGARRCAAIFSDRAHLFASQTGKALHELYYSYDDDSFISPSVSIRAEHLLRPRIQEMALAQEPYSIAWCRLMNNALVSMTYLKDQSVVAWSRHTGVTVKALAVIPTNEYDQLWIVTVRNGLETVEVLDDLFTGEESKADAFFLDGAMTFAIQGVTTHQLPHLTNTDITCLIDGAVYETTTNNVGNFTVPVGSYKIQAGLRYTSRINLLPPEIFTDNGSTLGVMKVIKKIWLDVYQSLGGEVDSESLEYRTTEDYMDQSENLFTGELGIPYPGRHSHKPTVSITTDDPFPMHIRNAVLEVSMDE
jgi:hypothetical protein